MAVLLPLLATITATLACAGIDTYKLWYREPTLGLDQILHASVFALGLNSMAGAAPGLILGLLLMVITRRQDLSTTWDNATRSLFHWLVKHNSRAESAAWAYAVVTGLGLLLLGGYLLNYRFFTTFHNKSLAALTLACLFPALLAVVVLLVLFVRVGFVRVMVPLSRVPVLRLLATISSAVILPLLVVFAATVHLMLSYLPIVQIIDWRALSYPGFLVLGTIGLLWFSLWLRHRRLEMLEPASPGRHLGIFVWIAVFIACWSYTLIFMGDQTLLRTALLRRGWGAAHSYEFVSEALDFDRDGYLSFFGGGDCDPFNSHVHPGAIEIPGNGIDDNCFGGDLDAKHLINPKRQFDFPLPAALAQKKFNFVIISMDGLRADHLGSYGYDRPTSPFIDKLAQRSIVFERAYTQGPSTRYSIPSFLSSKYSSQVPRQGTLMIPRPILPDALLMAEIFQDKDFRTGAALSYMVFKRAWQIDQGFDFYDNSHAAYYHGKGSPSWDKDQPYLLVDTAKKFLSTVKDQPFFLWTHFFEPHPPWAHRTKHKNFGKDIQGLFDGELRFGDEKVGELLAVLAKHPQADRTIIVFTADHGRGMGEHGTATHGYDLFVENLHVPLMFYVPGLKPRRIKNPVALLDLLPTLVNLAGFKDKYDFEGVSLVPQLVEGIEPAPGRAIFSEVQVGFQNSHVINAVTTRDYKLIYDVSFNTYQLFDLQKDPSELNNIAESNPQALKRLKGKLFKVMERATMPNIEEQIRASVIKKAPLTPGIKRVNFGNQIQFLGFEVQPERPQAGDVIHINWYIKSLTKVKRDFKVVVRLEGSKRTIFDAKHVPINGLYPMSKWPAGQTIRDRQHMRLSHVPQEYEVWVGFGIAHDYLKTIEPLKMVGTCVKVGTFKTF